MSDGIVVASHDTEPLPRPEIYHHDRDGIACGREDDDDSIQLEEEHLSVCVCL